METFKSQNIALDDKEARRLDRASTDGKIPRFSLMMMLMTMIIIILMMVITMMLVMVMFIMVMVMILMSIVMISGQTLLTMPKAARL